MRVRLKFRTSKPEVYNRLDENRRSLIRNFEVIRDCDWVSCSIELHVVLLGPRSTTLQCRHGRQSRLQELQFYIAFLVHSTNTIKCSLQPKIRGESQRMFATKLLNCSFTWSNNCKVTRTDLLYTDIRLVMYVWTFGFMFGWQTCGPALSST